MAETHAVTTLRRKRLEIEASIAAYERTLAQARADLSSVIATITLFEASGDPADMPRYVDLRRIYTRGAMWPICRAAIEAEGPLDTRELGVRLVRAKGLNEGDAVLTASVTYKCIQSLSIQRKRGTVVTLRKRRGAWVWELPQIAPMPPR